ncbi:EamA family transporter, partial [Bacteroidota bacterium]
MGLKKTDNFKAYWAWIIICIVWGTTYLAIRVGVTDLPPMLFAGFRWIIAGSILFIYLRLRGKKLPARDDFIHLAIIGVVMLGVANGLVVFAEQWIPSGLASLLITTVPFFFVGVESLVPHGPKLNRQVIFGLLLGLVGVGLIFGGDIESLFIPEYFWGVISLLGAVVAWAVGSVYSKYKKMNVTPLMGATIQMLVAGLGQLGFGLS